MSFDDLRLCEPLLRAVRAAGYQSPTPIQSAAIPIVLSGRDVLGCAQTGTGKTAAFALPILQRLSENASPQPCAADRHAAAIGGHRRPARSSRRGGGGRSRTTTSGANTSREGQHSANPAPRGRARALVLCPTRELAQQIHDSFASYGAHTGVRAAVIFGGVNQNPQARALRAGVDVIIATPGRLLDLIGQGLVNLGGVEMLVLDEADRMLDMGFLPDIRRILAQLPRQRQSLLFSATMPAPIRALAGDMLREPVPIQVARVSSPAVTVAHSVYHVEPPRKATLLVHLLEGSGGDRTLVFTRTKRGADKLTRHLVGVGVRAAALHGNKSQGARTRALEEFRSAQTPVLVATDLAARGLDVDDIARVINYDLTADAETYIHRIGRTGRAGASGQAISFCSGAERDDLRAIERLLGAAMQRAAAPPLAREPDASKPDRRGAASDVRPVPHNPRGPRQPHPGALQSRSPRRGRPGAGDPPRRGGGRRTSRRAVATVAAP